MRLTENQSAPLFSATDVYGQEANLNALGGKSVYLAFERNAGCPVCNFRTHELLKQADFFTTNNITVLMIYESSVEAMKDHLGENSYPFQFIADPQNKLYNLYGVERSFIKVMRGLFNGLLNKVTEGNKLFSKPMKQDGHLDRIPAEFIIDKNGKIKLAHYGKFVGDHVPIEQLIKLF
ncbi:alkyl hydroperoxide reductase [Chryseotalea sanaruensis]|uniref:Alkyl hydroperoxide reductase n=1 Tax=Chryseotalea sanaruensis TaxID=2482724 RepID=A0A401U8V7_9BACT|nr:redoxin domain-containing protein [Chryseotalea sanaruensis]GCC51307.1 alkyl hydroperoxide reductase [Chryseotalea sanaruensis]